MRLDDARIARDLQAQIATTRVLMPVRSPPVAWRQPLHRRLAGALGAELSPGGAVGRTGGRTAALMLEPVADGCRVVAGVGYGAGQWTQHIAAQIATDRQRQVAAQGRYQAL